VVLRGFDTAGDVDLVVFISDGKHLAVGMEWGRSYLPHTCADSKDRLSRVKTMWTEHVIRDIQ